MKNPKSLVCAIFGVLFILAALVLRGTGNGELVVTAIIAGIFLLIVSYHMYKEPERYADEDDDEDDDENL